MAGSALTYTTKKISTTNKEFTLLTFTWTSDDTTGAVSGTTTEKFRGQVRSSVTDPGTPAPTANYDIVLTDERSSDVLNGGGANRSATLVETKNETSAGINFGVVFDSTLTFDVTNAGNSKQGVAYIIIES